MAGSVTDPSILDVYPALSTIPMLIPHLPFGGRASLPWYTVIFALLMVVAAAATAKTASALTARLLPGKGSRAYFVTGMMLLLAAPVVGFRYDVVPAFLAGLGVLAVVAGWPLAGGVALGLSAGLKVYAGVVLIVALLWFWSDREWGRTARFTTGVGIAVVLALLPYTLFPGSNPLSPIAFNTGRPLQIESVAGGVASLLTLTSPLPVTFTYGSYNFIGELPANIGQILSPIQAGTVATTLLVIAVAFLRSARSTKRSEHQLMTAVLASILALIISSKVLSAQYILWLLPFIAVLATDSRKILILGVSIFSLTLLIFPIGYAALIDQHPLAIAVLNVRNAMLVGIWVMLLRELLRSPSRRPWLAKWRGLSAQRRCRAAKSKEHRGRVVDPQVRDRCQAGNDGDAHSRAPA
jgi:hypothetical protein